MRWLLPLLAGCSPGPTLVDGPSAAPGAVLLTTTTPDLVEVKGSVLAPLWVDIDDKNDDRHPWRYQVVDDEGEVLYERSTPSPLIVQTWLGYYGATAGIDILDSFPSLGQFAFQVPLLPGAVRVHFQQRNAGGLWRQTGTYDLSRLETDDMGLSDKVVGWETLHRSGSSASKLDIVLVGDGFTEAQQEGWRNNADRLAEAILSEPPLEDYADFLNIHRVDAVSAQSGASFDCGDCGFLDTAFDSMFAVEAVNRVTGGNYSARAIFQADQFEVARAVSHVPWDMVVVVSNSRKPGGMAVHFATVTVYGQGWADTGVHELGHILGLLGDEYVGDPCIRSDAMPLPGNIGEDLDDLPWKAWIAEGTSLPTPGEVDGVIGAFPPAFNCSDLYRPARSCKMRGSGAFCDVCTELLVRETFRHADLIEGFEVDGRALQLLSPNPALTATWSVDGEVVQTGLASEPFKLRGTRGKPVQVELSDPTDKVRSDPWGDLQEVRTFQWD